MLLEIPDEEVWKLEMIAKSCNTEWKARLIVNIDNDDQLVAEMKALMVLSSDSQYRAEMIVNVKETWKIIALKNATENWLLPFIVNCDYEWKIPLFDKCRQIWRAELISKEQGTYSGLG